MDAARAIELLGMADRGTFRSSLAATLVKDARDRAAFDRLFAAFFDAPESLGEGSDADALLREIAESLDGIAAEVLAALADRNAAALEALLAEAHEALDLPARFPFQRAMLVQRIAERIGVWRIRAAMAARAGQAGPGFGGGLSSGTSQRPAGAAPADPLEPLMRAIERFASRAIARAAGPTTPGAADRTGLLPLSEPSQEEKDAVARAAALFGKRLREQNARRLRRAKRGRIDIRHTISRSVATGGVPFVPRMRRIRPARPNLIALCDVSPSMRSTTRFTLLFLHSIAAEIARVRSFFFVDGIAEVSGFFRERSLPRAVARALAEADLDVGARTDYGWSFRDFDRKHGRLLTRRTTLVILGDARSNYSDPGEGYLRRWRSRVKRIVFLNPEAPVFWGSGDSAMLRYEPLIDVVAECRTPAHLRDVVDALSGSRSRRRAAPRGVPRF